MSHLYDVYQGNREGTTLIPTEFVPRWVHPVLGWVSSIFSGSVVIQAAMTPQAFQAWGAAVVSVIVLAFNGFLFCYNQWMKRAERKAILKRLSDDDTPAFRDANGPSYEGPRRGSNMRGDQNV